MGKGQIIDIGMADGALTWQCLRWWKYLVDKTIPSCGDDFLNYACYNIYATQDGRYMSLGALEPQFWKLCQTVNRSDCSQANYFEPGPHQMELQDQVAELFRGQSQAYWIQQFDDIDCCCEPVLILDEVMRDEQVLSRKMVVNLIHESWGVYSQLGIAPKFWLTPGTIRGHAPELGEHTEEILDEIGLSRAALEEFRTIGII